MGIQGEWKISSRPLPEIKVGLFLPTGPPPGIQAALLFQGLEARVQHVPRSGKIPANFSKPWKNFREIFQGLENSPFPFPMSGNRRN
jgi:hypothetical protein